MNITNSGSRRDVLMIFHINYKAIIQDVFDMDFWVKQKKISDHLNIWGVHLMSLNLS